MTKTLAAIPTRYSGKSILSIQSLIGLNRKSAQVSVISGKNDGNIQTPVNSEQHATKHNKDLKTQNKQATTKLWGPDYNEIVAQSNRALVKFESWYKLNNYSFTRKDAASGSKGAETKHPSIEKQHRTSNHGNDPVESYSVGSVNAISETMLAVELAETKESILLMNSDKVSLRCLDVLFLEQGKAFTINGSPTKIYSRWKVLR